MAVNNLGLQMIGSFLRGLSPTSPKYMIFDAGSEQFFVDKYNAEDERLRKDVTWGALEINDSRCTCIVATTELVGSYIYNVGLTTGSVDLGSDMVARETAALGEKTQYQNWIMNIDWRNKSY